MAILVDRRDDGTLAVYYDGDLQFDSRDEAVYHTALTRPALTVAAARGGARLTVLVLGGGDGLAARDLLVSPLVEGLTLVDLDPAMLALARGTLAALNRGSLLDSRVTVAIDDAWRAVETAGAAGHMFDVIVVDLTVPRDLAGARFHTIDWYRGLGRLLGPRGLVAVNAASPCGRPDAYWSIVNAMRAAGLPPVPYRVKIPSFAARGYGDDWGFVLGSQAPVTASELVGLDHGGASGWSLPGWRAAFQFPAASADRQATARPTRLGGHMLLHYLINSAPIADATGAEWDGLTAALPPLPPADDGRSPLTPDLAAALAMPVGHRLAEAALFDRVMALMPALHPDQTRVMIATFLAAPARFLAGLDMAGLVDRLLRRAGTLPGRLVAELRALRRLLARVSLDPERLLGLGLRLVTVVTLVVILANLAFPDAVYGKGGDPGSSSATRGATTGLAATSRSVYDPRASESVLAAGSGFRSTSGGRVAVDEGGTAFPARHYRGLRSSSHYRSHASTGATPVAAPVAPPVEEDESDGVYRLTPDTDILPDGRVVTALTDDAYVVLGPQSSLVVDQRTGQPLLTLDREPTQVWRAVKEIERQRDGLKVSAEAKRAWLDWLGWLAFVPDQADDERELANLEIAVWRLEQARAILGSVPAEPPPLPAPPLAGASEVISGVWLLPDGSGLAVRRPEGLAILDGKGWYRDAARQNRLTEPYPDGFRALMTTLLTQQVRDRDATRARLDSEVTLAQEELSELLVDKGEYDSLAASQAPTSMVEYGPKEVPLQEAQRLTNASVTLVQQRLSNLQTQIARLPAEAALAERALVSLRP
ncbi:MAG: hypothetical protein IT340_04755 [Chloroflexi bacterium]|nr:hypothetical protein [Chloroflexota bacterium]